MACESTSQLQTLYKTNYTILLVVTLKSICSCRVHCYYPFCIHHHLFIVVQDGATPLFMASQNGHASVVDVLLRHGADPNLADHVSIAVVY